MGKRNFFRDMFVIDWAAKKLRSKNGGFGHQSSYHESYPVSDNFHDDYPLDLDSFDDDVDDDF